MTYPEAEQERARALVAQMTALAAAGDLAAVREGYGAGRVTWVELLADADIQPDLVETFETASSAVRDRIAADDRARMEADQQRQARAREQAERADVCARVEAIQGEDIPDQVAAARAEWEGMPAMPESWAAELSHRFEEACRAAEKRHERRLTAKEMAERLPTLLPEMEAVAAAENYTEVRSQWFALRKQWQAIARELEIDPELTSRYDLATQAIEAKEQVLRDAKAGDQQKNLQRLQAVVLELETRAAAESLTLKGADTLMKDIKLAIGTMGPLPTKQDRDDLTVRLQAVRTSLAPRIQEMREGEEWKRWANVQVQEELCTKMEALVAIAEASPDKAATEMKELQERWKSVAAAPRSQATVLWTRFKAAQDQVYEKCKDFFAQQNVERAENLKKKTELAERAEALQHSNDWVKTADAIKQLQADWKTIGPVTRGNERAIWERFRAACDAFFTRRQEDLKQRKHDWTENLRKKEALVTEAEQLAQSSEWEKAAARIKQMQLDWKNIGPVKRSKSEAIWQRFRAACDLFFERFKNRDQAALQGKVADRETPVAELEALVPADDAGDAADAGRSLRPRAGGARPLGAGAGPAAAHLAAAGRSRQRRDAEAGHALAAGVCRHRRGSGGDARSHDEADQQGGEAAAGGERRAGEEPLAGRVAGAPVARSAGRQHHGRRFRTPGRGRAAARRRAGSAERPVGLGTPRTACRGRAVAAAGALRSRRAEVLRDEAAVNGENLRARVLRFYGF